MAAKGTQHGAKQLETQINFINMETNKNQGVMKYYIKVWETETEREQGNPFKYGPYEDKHECLKDAERMHYSGYAFIEVVDQDEKLYCEFEN